MERKRLVIDFHATDIDGMGVIEVTGSWSDKIITTENKLYLNEAYIADLPKEYILDIVNVLARNIIK